MALEKYDITFALKAIGLSESLSGTDKRTAITLLDHFNRKTGRCDPSRDTLAALLNVDERTVSRSIAKISKLKFFHVVRHGGHYNCNHYAPNWPMFRKLEREWQARRVQRAGRFGARTLSSKPGQDCHQRGDKVVPQINLTNNILPTSGVTVVSSTERLALGKSKTPARIAMTSVGLARRRICSTPFKHAALAAAERRWNADLMRSFGGDANVLGRIVEAVDVDLQERATVAEMDRRGSGLDLLITELQRLHPFQFSSLPEN